MTLDDIRSNLLKNRFFEAKDNNNCFFRPMKKGVAFAINLDADEYCITIMYGFDVMFMGSDECYLIYGANIDSCKIRNTACICNDEDTVNTKKKIEEFYNLYKDFSKEQILEAKKEREKEFLSFFARALKPLGFKKKGRKWTIALSEKTALTLEAQKSAYSDQFYFNVIEHSSIDFYRVLSYKRVIMFGRDIYNWQLMSDEQIENLVNLTIEDYIKPALSK